METTVTLTFVNFCSFLSTARQQNQSYVSGLTEEDTNIFSDNCTRGSNLQESCSAPSHQAVFTRKVAASAFWATEVRSELQEHSLLQAWAFNKQKTFKDFMEYNEHERVKDLYKHDNCSKECEARGCGRLFTTDGLWKLIFSHCMFKVPMKIAGFPTYTFRMFAPKKLNLGQHFACNTVNS
ncbi:uncharacterized protein [Ptychodera flava]|uniref:uncharacterized protein n=1 Tax=Ptychodera flava TaxID=63121 RepID=UPI00396A21D4